MMQLYKVPFRSTSNIITGYTTSPKPYPTLIPVSDSTGMVTGYRGDSSSVTPVPGTSNNIDPNNSDPLGMQTFSPYTGKNRQGRTRGEQAAFDFNQNTGLVTTTKDPAVESDRQSLLGTERNQAASLTKSFQDYLDEAKQLQSGEASQIAKDSEAYSRIPKKLETELSDSVQNFADAGANVNQQFKDYNAAHEQQVNQNIASLDNLNTQYEDAARGVAGRALDYATARNNAFSSASGTPRSGSGYQNELAAKTYSDVMLPVEQQISQNRISQLTNYVTPQQQQLYAENISRLTGVELPVAQTLASMGISNAGQVAQLAAALQGRSLQEQMQYLSSLGVPIQLAQTVMDSLPRALTQLSQLGNQNNFYTMTQDYQNPITAPLPTYSGGYPNITPAPYRPTSNPYANPYAVNNYLGGGPELPTTVTPGGAYNGAGYSYAPQSLTPRRPNPDAGYSSYDENGNPIPVGGFHGDEQFQPYVV